MFKRIFDGFMLKDEAMDQVKEHNDFRAVWLNIGILGKFSQGPE